MHSSLSRNVGQIKRSQVKLGSKMGDQTANLADSSVQTTKNSPAYQMNPFFNSSDAQNDRVSVQRRGYQCSQPGTKAIASKSANPQLQSQASHHKIDTFNQIQVSQFLGEQVSQAEESNLSIQQENQNNQKVLTNIERIVGCKKDAQILISQIGGYIELISKLQCQNNDYKQQMRAKERENKKLRDTLHRKQMQILGLQQEMDRIRRMQSISAAKVRVLREITQLNEKQKWESMLRNRLGVMNAQEAPWDAELANFEEQANDSKEKGEQNCGRCCWSSQGCKKRVSECNKPIEGNPEVHKRGRMVGKLLGRKGRTWGQVAKSRQNREAWSARKKWEEESTIF